MNWGSWPGVEFAQGQAGHQSADSEQLHMYHLSFLGDLFISLFIVITILLVLASFFF